MPSRSPQPPSAPRVLWLSLDAADPGIVRQMSEAGRLPTFASLFETAAWSPTANPPGLYTGSVWPSLFTGVSPGRHGTYYCEQLRTGSYDIVPFSARDIKHEPFWVALGRQGRRMALFDVPKAPLTEGLNGLQITDWGTHDAEEPTASWPPALVDEVARRHGRSPFVRCDYVMRGPDPEKTLREQLLARIQTKTEIALDLAGREAWDLFAVGFGDSHCVGHQCWHLHDAAHPQHDAALVARVGDPLCDVYEGLDRALGHLLGLAGPDTTAVVLLSHGMNAHYDATFLLDEVLRRIEGVRAPLRRRALDVARDAWRRLPPPFTERFRRVAQAVDRHPDAPERARRSFFAVPTNSNCAGIRINRAGREPQGRVRPGPELEALCARLVEELHQVVDAHTGRPVVKEVLRSDALFPGEHRDDLPDLLVRWNRESLIRAVESPRIGRVAGEDRGTRRTGDHRPEGLLLARGPGIAPGPLPRPVRAEDVAPTLASLLGVTLADVDGCAVPGIAGARGA